jgi:N-dimethylarginine dimethylaminohydrolase
VSAVSSYTDFGLLEEIVLGTATGYHLPPAEVSYRHFFGLGPDDPVDPEDAGALARAVAETEEDLAAFAEVLTGAGVSVRRPEPLDQSAAIALPGWQTTANHALMPRDCLLVVGDTVIEAPMPVRSRYAETFALRGLLREWFQSGAHWVGAPRPQLPDETYLFPDGELVLAEREPLFDAANVLRLGTDLFFNVSNTGNRIGARWLARVLGPQFRVHEISVCDDHLGTTLQVLRPGVLLANAGRLDDDMIPEPLRRWKIVWFDEPEDDGYALRWPRASVWIGMNVVCLDEDTIVVPARQTGLARLLEKEGFTTVPVPYRHGRTFGGGFHCCSLDVRRRDEAVSYL